jgi:hypothetical protein
MHEFFLKIKLKLSNMDEFAKRTNINNIENYSHVDDINEAYYVDEIGMH